MVVIKFKDIKKRCIFFVVSGNGQAMLGMSGTAALKLISIDIDSIQAEAVECKKHRTGNTCSGAKLCKHGCRFKNPNKTPTVKMPKTMQSKQLITFSHHPM